MDDYNRQLQEKKDAIKEIESQQMDTLKKIESISKRPTPKRNSTMIKRSTEAMKLWLRIRSLEVNKYIIISQPIFKESDKKECIVAGEGGEEVIVDQNGNFVRL